MLHPRNSTQLTIAQNAEAKGGQAGWPYFWEHQWILTMWRRQSWHQTQFRLWTAETLGKTPPASGGIATHHPPPRWSINQVLRTVATNIEWGVGGRSYCLATASPAFCACLVLDPYKAEETQGNVLKLLTIKSWEIFGFIRLLPYYPRVKWCYHQVSMAFVPFHLANITSVCLFFCFFFWK